MNKLLYKLRLVVYVYVVCLAVLNPFLASAQTPVQPTQSENQLQSYSGVEATIEAYLCTPSENPDGFDLQRCINKLYRVGIAVGALVLVFLVVLAGYMYITGSEGGKKRAKELIVSALVGMAVLLSSFVILRFINPNLTTFRPIQPPIFTAADIPSCEAIGFEDDCKLPSGEVVTSSSTTGTKGQRVACPGGKLVKAKALGLPVQGGENPDICEAFGQKLVGVWNNTKSTPWVITRTTTGAAESRCHKPGNEFTGTCADIDFTSGNDVKNATSWNALCRAVKGAGLYPHNEVGHEKDGTVALRSQLTDCGGFNQQTYATGDHIHVMWFSGN